jgi:hypothetical protein
MIARCCGNEDYRPAFGQVPALIVFTQAIIDKGSFWTTSPPRAMRREMSCGWSIPAP